MALVEKHVISIVKRSKERTANRTAATVHIGFRHWNAARLSLFTHVILVLNIVLFCPKPDLVGNNLWCFCATYCPLIPGRGKASDGFCLSVVARTATKRCHMHPWLPDTWTLTRSFRICTERWLWTIFKITIFKSHVDAKRYSYSRIRLYRWLWQSFFPWTC